ncbi:hypothetical protein HHI36_004720 [Cryptolaemus montrouzieri]|uniref:Guided entry of tail-anchored proteins factor 1 n=1 Tax=Cryptolaemus montrouzieri TaxID=559131 RepID=A0ABD2NSF5_9CUCU
MLLLIVSTLLSFLSVHSKVIGKPVLQWLSKISKEEDTKIYEIKKLKTEQQKLNMVDNFVEYSRIQRKINRLTESLGEIKNSKTANNFYIKMGLSYGLKIVLATLLIILSIYYRKTPVLYLDNSVNLTPFGYFISFPNSGNSVSFHFWVMCCTAVARLIKL